MAAKRVLGDVAEGKVTRGALAALALAVLATATTASADQVRLALEVRAGGTYAVRRAIELAALVLTESALSDAVGRAGE